NQGDAHAIERLYEIKQRPKDKPFSLHVDSQSAVERAAASVPPAAYRVIDKFWPGPLTVILKSSGGGTVGVRMPDNEITLKTIRFSGVNVVCPSANISGSEPPVNFLDAIRDLNGKVDFALDAGETPLKKESTIIDFSSEPYRIVREGAIPADELLSVALRKKVLFVCTGNSCRSVMAEWLFKKKLRELGRSDVDVQSAGVMPVAGMGATEATRIVLAREGIDASSHRAARITRDMLNKADLILVMERIHEENILGIAPQVKNRIFLLKEFARMSNSDLNVPDPIGASVEFYQETLNVIKEAVSKVAEII
ncbi:MAG: L-threonylcarbamoyladenylate synthase, partial [Candidatus Omnitrophica bacterium]|nr:L-threonylcarbamoyladenylate synthase [Candidatus Omnitrophota bacterium]